MERRLKSTRKLWIDVVLLGVASIILGSLHSSLRPVLPLFGKWIDPVYLSLPTVTVDTVKQLQADGGAVFVDARSFSSYRKGHLKGSISIPVDTHLASVDLKALQAAAIVIVYCASLTCLAADDEALALIKAGVSNVYVYRGGVREWRQRGYELVGGS